jgi:hypothetical protein
MRAWKHGQRGAAGFTMGEFMVASAVSLLVAGGFAIVFRDAIIVGGEGRQYAWAQSECVNSSRRITDHIRNAVAIDDIDLSGDWVQLLMPDGRVSRFEYVSDPNGDGDGYMTFVADTNGAAPLRIVSRGLTKVMTSPVRNVFAATGPTTMRVCYRVTEPMSPGECPAEIEFGVRLRNAP